jgi:hypothetical protein
MTDLSIYQLTDEEKADMVSRLTQDVTFLDEESLFETDEYFESIQDDEQEVA